MTSLEGFVQRRTAWYDPGFLGTSQVPGEQHVHAHVTVLGPFPDPPDPSAVRGLAARAPAFELLFDRVETFPNGIIHARPRDPTPALALTVAARALFPHTEPYGGRFPVAPHVTLDAVGPGVDEAWVTGQLGALLPARERVTHLDVVWYESGRTGLLARWPLARPSGPRPGGPDRCSAPPRGH